MSTPEAPNPEPSKSASIPRWLVPILWAVGFPLVHVALPWSISLLSTRYGWVAGRPGTANFFAWILILIGLGGVLWTMALHLARTASKVKLERTPTYLLRQGPYQFTRNPMYLAELILWLGWALFYGSIAVFISLLIIGSLMNFRSVPREERELEGRFGEAYRQYKRTVPRWLGKTRN